MVQYNIRILLWTLYLNLYSTPLSNNVHIYRTYQKAKMKSEKREMYIYSIAFINCRIDTAYQTGGMRTACGTFEFLW